jgi:isoleucyl-tRNA synthetase
MVDKLGRKMSKSEGNTIEVEELLKDFGADVCRWWVSSLSYENDIKVDVSYFKVAGEEYRKVRNTLRFLLGNLGDFDPSQDRYAFSDADATSIDAWAMGELNRVVAAVTDGYEHFQYRRVHEAIFNFCNDTLSAVYLAATKDRLYCDRPDSPRRRRTQTAMFDIASAVIRLMAPILPHTADEAWAALNKADVKTADSVHLERLPQTTPLAVHEAWAKVMEQRDDWMKVIEDARQELGIDNPLDIGLIVPPGDGTLTVFDAVDLADLCGISRFVWHDAADKPTITDLSEEPRCERSWKRDGTVHHRSDGGELSDRDAQAVGVR